MKTLTYLSLGASLVLAGISPIFFKLALVHIKGKGLSLGAVKAFLTNRYAILGLMFYAISSFLWLVSLSDLPASLMYPLLNLAYVLTVLLASLYLKEPVHVLRWIGIFLIIVGSILVGVN